jgi:hypothetical protein
VINYHTATPLLLIGLRDFLRQKAYLPDRSHGGTCDPGEMVNLRISRSTTGLGFTEIEIAQR